MGKEKREEEKRVKLAERDERRKPKQAVKKEREADGGEWETVDGSTGTRFIEIFATGETIVKMFDKSKEKDLKDKHILDKHQAIIDTRGKKNYHRKRVLLQLNELIRITLDNQLTFATLAI